MSITKPFDFRELLDIPGEKGIRIAIGSGNNYKIRAIMAALEELNPNEEIWVDNADVPSGVSEQPVGNEETFKGAENRIEEIKKRYPDADIWIAVEAGLDEMGKGHYANVQACVIKLKNGRTSRGKSAGYEVPPEWCKVAMTKEGGMATVFKERFGPNKGGTRRLTENFYTRAKLIGDAVKLAIFSLNW